MDLSKLDTRTTSEQGAVLELRHPATGERLDSVWIRLAGADSDIYRRVQNRIVRRNFNRKGKRSQDEIEEAVIEQLAGITLAWEGIELHGEYLECNQENAQRVYQIPWIREQVAEFVNERANFLPRYDSD